MGMHTDNSLDAYLALMTHHSDLTIPFVPHIVHLNNLLVLFIDYEYKVSSYQA